MSKGQYRPSLRPLLDERLAGGSSALEDYLVANSNLPGPAGNLTLVYDLADDLLARVPAHGAQVWDMLGAWADVPPDVAPANDPREFLPFAAAYAHGAIAATYPDYWHLALARLRVQATDPRWRTRETVALGLQAMARARFDDLWYFLFNLVDEGDAYGMRAAAAAVAEPDLMADEQRARAALGLHAEILVWVALVPAAGRKSDAFRALRQGLGYTLSVVVAGLPNDGIAMLRAWLPSTDPDIRWILRENLKKKRILRLLEAYPQLRDLVERLGLTTG